MPSYDEKTERLTPKKTTTTSMISWVLSQGPLKPTSIIGGIDSHTQSNLQIGSSDWMVVEADESDKTFVKLPSKISVITNIDYDHLENYGSIEKLEASNKALELKLERTIKGLEDSKSGISKAISKTKDQSVEIQGEVAEELLQSNLEEAFPNDSFVPIKKGQRGADIKQVIFTEGGYEAGSILFESKNTSLQYEN